MLGSWAKFCLDSGLGPGRGLSEPGFRSEFGSGS